MGNGERERGDEGRGGEKVRKLGGMREEGGK